MKELAEILNAWSELRRAGNAAAVLATVVKVDGSAYRRPGARMLLTAEGRRLGVISGGCLESHLLDVAWDLTRERSIAITQYDTTSDVDVVFGSGAGCRGVIHVMLERLEAGAGPDRMAFREACRGARRTGVLATVIGRSSGLEVNVGEQVMLGPDGTVTSTITNHSVLQQVLADARSCALDDGPRVTTYTLSSGTAEVFQEVIAPPTSLLVFGAGPDAAPLVRLAKELGWHVSVMDMRPAFLSRERFPLADQLVPVMPEAVLRGVSMDPKTVAVVMSHDFLQDLATLESLLSQPLKYLGILGPKSRTERLLSELASHGRSASEEVLQRLHAPVGLDIGAEAPGEIALAIVAEIQAVLRGRSGGGLRERAGSIHRETGTPQICQGVPEETRV